MKANKILILAALAALTFTACGSKKQQTASTADSIKTDTPAATEPAPARQEVSLPAPYATKSVKNYSKVTGWKQGEAPVAPAGFTVTRFAEGLESPRWIYVGPNGDIFVAEANTEMKGIKKIGSDILGHSKSERVGKSANRITLFRDRDGDGRYEVKSTFLSNLNKPFGMLIIGNRFFVANTDGLWVYPYTEDETSITKAGSQIMELPAGGYNNHWTRNIVTNANQSKIYVTVGSGSNVGEHGMENEVRRANILEINTDGSGEKVYASGLRNPVGLAWAPGTKTLYTAVNERDELGDELVPDYLTSVKEGGFYGWPYSYWGQNADPRLKGEHAELVKEAITPDVPLGAHTASLGLAFTTTKAFPEKYRGGAFIGQHGSWNRSTPSGYKVVYVPFKNGVPSGKPEDFLTGFMINRKENEVHGRPVGIAETKQGNLLVADDAANTLWFIAPKK